MKLSTECFLAWRYFKPKRNAVSVITLISVVGVALGVAVLIVVISIMTGFTDHLKDKLLETGSHGQIRLPVRHYSTNPRGNAGVFSEEQALLASGIVEKLGGEALPVLLSPVLLQVGEAFNPKAIIACNPENGASRFQLDRAIRSGRMFRSRNEILVSEPILQEFHLQIGDKILLHSPSSLAKLVEKDPATGRYRASKDADYYLPQEFVVCGTFSFDKYDFDKDIMFMALDDGDDLFNLMPGSATQIFFWTEDPFRMDPFMDELRKALDETMPEAEAYSWKQLNSRILEVLGVEKNMMFFLLVFIVLVAAFCITTTLITTVIQKTREIGLLKSMGATSFVVLRVFLMQGLFVGILGTAGGTLLGWLVVAYRMKILGAMRFFSGQEIFPKEIYLFNELPARIVWSDVAVISLIAVALCTIGALLPAVRAAKLDPAKALRYE